MKIQPSLSTVSTSRTVSAPPLLRSFKDFLSDARALKLEGRQRAFGFAERGLLGAGAAAAQADAPRQGGPAQVTAPPDAPDDQEFAATQSAQIASPLPPHPFNPSDGRWMEMLQAPLPGVQLAGDDAPPPMIAVSNHGPASTGDLETGAEPIVRDVSGANEQRRQSLANPAATRLVVAGENGAIQVLAASPDLEPAARARLRKAFAEVAAAFGTTLAGLTLNGAQIEPPAFDLIGAPHGDRTR